MTEKDPALEAIRSAPLDDEPYTDEERALVAEARSELNQGFGVTSVSACVLIEREDGKLLGVSRRDNHADWGLPGGKMEDVDRGDPRRCAARELYEETGIVYPFEGMIERFRGPARTSGRVAIAYSPTLSEEIPVGFPSTTPFERDGALVDWVSWSALFSGSFVDYNRALYEAARAHAARLFGMAPLLKFIVGPEPMKLSDVVASVAGMFQLSDDDAKQVVRCARWSGVLWNGSDEGTVCGT